MSNWIEVGSINDVPKLGSRVVQTVNGDIAVFRTDDDQIFALRDECPHSGGPLSQGIVHGTAVACPLHNWNIDLQSGEVLGPDEGCTNVVQVALDGEKIKIFVELQKTGTHD